MNLKHAVMLLVGVLIGMGIQAALAKGLPDKVVISSPGLPHDIVITNDICTLNALAMGNLEDPTMRVNSAPQGLGSGYLVTRYMQTTTGYLPMDQVRFYPDPRGGYGYVLDLGGVESDEAGHWFRPTLQSEFVMQYLLTNLTAPHTPMHQLLTWAANAVQ